MLGGDQREINNDLSDRKKMEQMKGSPILVVYESAAITGRLDALNSRITNH